MMKKLSTLSFVLGCLVLPASAGHALERKAVPLLEAKGSWSSWVESSYYKYPGGIFLDKEDGKKQFLATDSADVGARCVSDAVMYLKNNETKKYVDLFHVGDGSRAAISSSIENTPSGIKQARVVDRLDIGSLSVYSIDFGEQHSLMILPFIVKREGHACHLVAHSLFNKYVKYVDLFGLLQLNIRERWSKAGAVGKINYSTQVSKLQVDLGIEEGSAQQPQNNVSLFLLFDNIESRDLDLASKSENSGSNLVKDDKKIADIYPIKKLLEKAKSYKQDGVGSVEDYLKEALGTERARSWPQAMTICENEPKKLDSKEYTCEYKTKFLEPNDYFEEIVGWDQVKVVASMPGDGYKYYVVAGYANEPAKAEDASKTSTKNEKSKNENGPSEQLQGRLRGIQFIAIKGGGSDYVIDGDHVLGSPVDVFQNAGVVSTLATKLRLPMTIPAKK